MIGLKKTFISGIIICFLLAICAYVLSAYVGGPYMLYALALGMLSSSFLYKLPHSVGIDYTGKKLLRVGVALLGARITFAEVSSLGFDVVFAICVSVIATMIFGAIAGKILRVGVRMGVLTGGSTAICGASAAMAVSSVLPHDKKLEQQTLFTVVGVNVLSTVAMVLYPLLALWLGYNTLQSGVFLGGSIHDVAQVVGAGFSMSDTVGNIATITKLLRVAMLLPMVFGLAFVIYWLSKQGKMMAGGEAQAPFPFFLLVFLILIGLNSFGFLSLGVGANMDISAVLAKISKGLLTMAVIALGMKTSVRELMSVGHKAMILLVLEMIFITIAVMGISSYML